MNPKFIPTPEQLEYIREHMKSENSDTIGAALGVSKSVIIRICKEHDIPLKRQFKKNFCDPPETCFNCPLPDCRRSGCTQKETDFIVNSLESS